MALFGTISLLPVACLFMPSLLAGQGVDPEPVWQVFDGRHLLLAKNSVGVAAGSAAASLVLGALFAFLIYRTDMAGRKWLQYGVILPILIPPYMHAIVWSHWSRILNSVSWIDLHTLGGVIGVLTLAYFPFAALTTSAGLRSIDANREEAALMAGGGFEVLRRITLPLCGPHMLSGALFVFVLAIINVGVPDILRLKVYPLEIFIQFSAFYDNRAAAALSVPMILLTLGLMLLLRRTMRNRSYVQIGGGRRSTLMFGLGPWRWAGTAFCTTILLLSVGIPLATLAAQAGGIDAYVRVLGSSFEAIGLSLWVALLGAAATAALGTCLAYLQQRMGGAWATALSFAVVIPFAVPATAVGIGLIGVWNRPIVDGVYGSLMILVIACMARLTPYAGVVMTSGFAQVGTRIEEAAALTGASFGTSFRKIILPLTKTHLLAGFFIVFILALGELGTTLLVSPPGTETVPIKIYNLMHYGAQDLVAALCIILLGLIFAMALLFSMAYKRLQT